MSAAIRRRKIIVGGAAAAIAASTAYWYVSTARQRAMKRAAPFVLPRERWNAQHLTNFLMALPDDALKDLLRAQDQGEGSTSHEQDVRRMHKHLLWLSTNVLEYPVRDASRLDYHKVVHWAAGRTTVAGASSSTLSEELPTFVLERELYKRLFANVWDKLSPAQRQELLDQIDPHRKLQDRAAIVAMGGAAALAALSTAAAFAGFALYTTMSVAIAMAAGALGVTVPFAAYMGASTAVALLSGPVGWAVLAALGLGGVALAGRANVGKTAVLVAQIHTLKVEALVAAGQSIDEVI